MSNIIKLLPEHIANQIAAGEVIQRPASVVKELMENAIDAGAEKIQVIIKDAGRTLIQLIDNGKGMSAQDALICFERHATSKVQTADDLFALQTKGFRGEALASIAAIAHVTLKTRTGESETGTHVIMEGSKLVSKEECVSPVGTSFEIKNLFFNVPARRNFLKSDNVEFNHIVDEFERIVLAHPELHFSLKHNDQEIYQLHPGVLRKRIVDVLGKSSNDKLVPVDETTDIVKITGYVGKPEFAKRSRGEQFFFVNDRFFKDVYFNSAVNKAFDGMVQPKMFPSYFLYLEIDPKKIDVNVHPTKTEIKFEEDRSIYSILLSSIRQALGKYNIAPTLDFERETSFDLPHSMKGQPAVEPIINYNPDYNPFQSTESRRTNTAVRTDHSPALRAEGFGNTQPTPEDWQQFYKIEEEDAPIPAQLDLEEDEEQFKGSKLLKGKYLFTPCKSGIMVIHLERAVERIVYDEMMNDFISKPIASQKLLFPFVRECTNSELREWSNHTTLIQRLGFESTVHGSEIHLNAVPSIITEENLHDCVNMILENISFKEIDKGEIAHELIRSVAASAARNRTFNDHDDALQCLIDQLFVSPEHVYSPSGKRILSTITLDEIATKF
jgi:DNA mismatch repair protein MutL